MSNEVASRRYTLVARKQTNPAGGRCQCRFSISRAEQSWTGLCPVGGPRRLSPRLVLPYFGTFGLRADALLFSLA